MEEFVMVGENFHEGAQDFLILFIQKKMKR